MKIHSLLALVGMALGFAWPSFAQEKESTLSEQDRQQIDALATKYAEAVNQTDAAAIAALFTEEGVFVTPAGILTGRAAVEKFYQGQFKDTPVSDSSIKTVDLHGAGNLAWAVGQWANNTAQGNWGAVDERTDGTWKIRMLTFNVTPPAAAASAATPSPTATPE